MRYLPLACLLLASSLWGQQEPPSPPAPQSQPSIPRDDDDQQGMPESASKVEPGAAVITIKGICTPPLADAAKNPHLTCRTQVSRAEFEKLTDAILPGMQPAKKRQLAESYPSILAMAQAAQARGLENSARFQQRMAFARLQILAQELIRDINQESAEISDQEIADYYHAHSAELDRATLERIYIPNRKGAVAASDDKAMPAVQGANSEAESQQLAEKLRTRAAAGESFAALQTEAYTSLGRTEVPPNSSLGAVPRSGLPAGHTLAFDLKPGEVSQVVSDTTGFYIYKLDSKEVGPSEKMNAEIRRLLRRQRRDKAIQAIEGPVSAELNKDYFGAEEKPGGASPKP